MEELIDIANRLHEVFTVAGIGVQALDLPQVVVIGSQSSGKSSVLEHLAGRSFLPRGPGVVTRCPIELQLTHADAATAAGAGAHEYAIFRHAPSKVFTDYGLIAKEIEEQTERLAGANKGICSTPIGLRLYSASRARLTLVDLPGLTKVPVGDQPPNVEEQTRQLALRYAKDPDAVLLAVAPANADMATCEGLKLAREVDPDGARTLAVVTKLDLMDSGTDGRDVLTGRVIPVKLGIVGVVNRSQRDIVECKSVRRSLRDEAAFFRDKYPDIAHLHGTPRLAATVQALLVKSVRRCLPKIKERVSRNLEACRKELRALGDSGLEGPALLLNCIIRYSAAFCSSVRGNVKNVRTDELHGGARIKYVFETSLAGALAAVDPAAGLGGEAAVAAAVRNAAGVRPALFASDAAFEPLAKRQIERLREPCLRCVDLVHDELARIARDCVDDPELGLGRFPELQAEIFRVATELLSGRVPNTKKLVEDLVDVQLAYINTAHPDFVACQRAARARADADESPAAANCRLVRALVPCYFAVARGSVQDAVPKAIMHLMVNRATDRMQTELVARLYRAGRGDADRLLAEGPATAARRRDAQEAAAAMERALDVLAEVGAPRPTAAQKKENDPLPQQPPPPPPPTSTPRSQ